MNPPKRWWTNEEVTENPNKYPQVNPEGTGFVFSDGSGEGGSPGGENNQVQFNDGGNFGGLPYGTSGQVLTSGGDGNAPSWEDAAGGSSLFPVTGTGTATGNVIGDLDGNTLSVQQGGNDFLLIDPTANGESAILRAFNATDGGNAGRINGATTDEGAEFNMVASFNGVTEVARIDAEANASGALLFYSADTHTFTGNFKSGSANAWDLDGNTLSVQHGGLNFLFIDPTVNDESAALAAYNTTGFGNYARIQNLANDVRTQFTIDGNFNDGTKVSSIVGFADATTSTITYSADTHTFNGDNYLHRSGTAMADGAAAEAGTLLNAPVAGNPLKWLTIDDNGTTLYVPAWGAPE